METYGQHLAHSSSSPIARLVREPAPLTSRCKTCVLSTFCLPAEFLRDHRKQTERITCLPHRLRAGQHLYWQGEPFRSVYVLHSGMLKTTELLDNGMEKVNDFHMAGTLLGLDGIDGDCYSSSAVALQESEVCIVPFDQLEEVSRTVSALQHRLHKFMGREVRRAQTVTYLLGRMKAEERLAAFFLDLSRRYAAQGCSPTRFSLPMSREDIASYLGLSVETISRQISRLQDLGLLMANKRDVELRNTDGLQRMLNSGA